MDSDLHSVAERPERAETERIQERLATNLRTRRVRYPYLRLMGYYQD